jgi:hypothetical protein
MPLDPTTRGDVIAERLRHWYEANRETWWDRNRFLPWRAAPDRAGVHADEFMLGLINELRRIDKDTPR